MIAGCWCKESSSLQDQGSLKEKLAQYFLPLQTIPCKRTFSLSRVDHPQHPPLPGLTTTTMSISSDDSLLGDTDENVGVSDGGREVDFYAMLNVSRDVS